MKLRIVEEPARLVLKYTVQELRGDNWISVEHARTLDEATEAMHARASAPIVVAELDTDVVPT